MSLNKQHRTAFTLVELLVVIAIIGVLAALLLPAVNAARGAARKTECTNNMRNVGQAMLNYESARGQLPAFAKTLGDASNRHITGFVYSILPQIEKSVLRDEIDELLANGNTNVASNLAGSPGIKIMNCPSNPTLVEGGSSISYVANGARFDSESRIAGINNRANGAMSLDLGDTAGHASTLDYISSRDGTSQTALVSENVRYSNNINQAMSWLPEPSGGAALNRVLNQQTMVWSAGLKGAWPNANAAYSGSSSFNAFNQDLENNSLAIDKRSTPSSYHSGGFVVAFADSHVSFINSGVDYHVYSGILTSSGRDVSVPDAVTGGQYQSLAMSQEDMAN